MGRGVEDRQREWEMEEVSQEHVEREGKGKRREGKREGGDQTAPFIVSLAYLVVAR